MATMVLDLDNESAARLKKLAESWQVSETEVVQRSLRNLENDAPPGKDPSAMLKAYHAKGGMDRDVAEQYLKEVYEDRKKWRDK